MLLLVGFFLSFHLVNTPITPSAKTQVQINQQVIHHSESRVSNHSNITKEREKMSHMAGEESKGKGMRKVWPCATWGQESPG
jgi:hypothetical protein